MHSTGLTLRQQEVLMHYYNFNIGDYYSHTSHLSLIEDLAYRRLIDKYYLNERSFNGRSTDVARLLGLVEHTDAVDYVLNQFFEQDEAGNWIHERIEDDLATYKSKLNAAKRAGKASAKARKAKGSEQTFNDRSTTVQPLTTVQPTNNQEPITNNQELSIKKSKPKKAAAVFCPPTLDQVVEYCNSRANNVDASKFVDFYSSKGWMVGRNKMKDWQAALRNWERTNNTNNNNQSNASGLSAAGEKARLAAQDWLNEGK